MTSSPLPCPMIRFGAQDGGEFPEDPLQRARTHATRLVPGRRSVQLDADGEAVRSGTSLNAVRYPAYSKSVEDAPGSGRPRSVEDGFSQPARMYLSKP